MTAIETESTERPVEQAFVCEDCDQRWYYTRNYCANCGGDRVATYSLTSGELVALTRVNVTPADVRSPNLLGLAEFGDVRVIAQLTDETASVGDTVTFAGEYQLRDGDTRGRARLEGVDSTADTS